MSYRSDRDALTARREALETDLRALRAKADERDEVAALIRETEQSLEALRQRIESPEPLRRLPLFDLDGIRIASPCAADWERMAGDERARFCDDCKLHVYNLSAMTRPEAVAFLRERTGRACVRFYRRHDGTVLTADCPVGARKKRVRRAVIAAAGVSAMTVAAIAGMVGLRPKRETCAMRQPNPVHAVGALPSPSPSTLPAPMGVYVSPPPAPPAQPEVTARPHRAPPRARAAQGHTSAERPRLREEVYLGEW